MKIAVLAGGLSPERDVSLASGSLIANALLAHGHEVLLLDLYLGMDVSGEPGDLFLRGEPRYRFEVPEVEPDLGAIRAASGNGRRLIGPNVLALCEAADLVFLALHGDIGENGKLQAVFETHGIRYTGTDSVGSLLAMDKDISKQLMQAHGIATPPYVCVSVGDSDAAGRVARQVGYPCFVKPCGCGSSVGVTEVADETALEAALDHARRYEDTVVVERGIAGRELTVGILAGRALPVIEIIPHAGFFDYKNKYQPGLTEEICPAGIPDALRERVQAEALRVHAALRLGSYSRVDFMVDAAGEPHCLEANTLPGMTPNSLLPKAAAAAGLSYEALCERIAEMAVR